MCFDELKSNSLKFFLRSLKVKLRGLKNPKIKTKVAIPLVLVISLNLLFINLEESCGLINIICNFLIILIHLITSIFA